MAVYSQGAVSVWGTGLSGGAPDSVRCARLPRPEDAALGNLPTAYGYNSPDCPVCTGLSGEPTVGRANGRPRNLRETRGRANGRKGGTGLSGVHRTVSSAPTAPKRQRSASPNKEGDLHRTVSGGVPDCPVCQATKGKNCLPGLLSTTPSCLGAINGPLGAWSITPSIH